MTVVDEPLADRMDAAQSHAEAAAALESAYADEELGGWLTAVAAGLVAGPVVTATTVASFTAAGVFAVAPVVGVAVAIARSAAQRVSDVVVSDEVFRQLADALHRQLLDGLLDEAEDAVRTIVQDVGNVTEDPNVRNAVRDAFSRDSARWRNHVARAARTTGTASLSAGVEQGAIERQKRSGRRTGLRWLSLDDSRTRLSHRDADGQVVALGQKFRVGTSMLRRPGDPLGPASEVVNCRCAIRPVALTS